VAQGVPLDVNWEILCTAAIRSLLINRLRQSNLRKAIPMTEGPKTKFSRRGFLKGAGVTAATTVIESANALARETKALHSDRTVGPDALTVKLDINGHEHSVTIEPRYTLAETLRDNLNLTGTKVVCDRGSCSACTVWIDKTPALACMTLAIDTVGRKITTIEGLSHGDTMHQVQAAFVKHDAMQCGFCTPGMVMSCAALLDRNPNPKLDDVKHAVSGNLCRCGTYPKVFAATLDVAQQRRQAAGLVALVSERQA
jgi:aerobic-type carbon monoxide dehydrogenase small subunit (CoxS/CutS family)